MKLNRYKIWHLELLVSIIFVLVLGGIGTVIGLLTHWVFGVIAALAIWAGIHVWARQ
jgi:hypothetical protein